ncbi:MAG: F0F1 ATP synthase subunit gamma [Gammaproteobacteria bacterium]|nr:F0F1 ATP synthase subunit gamma [Gammaproteobacteria bacterium]NIR30347.1 F0F1 ATP synthase subunit gamma [Gammaproteobacteria bacterium]NIR98191.1 F0F1 ATP synthase subunit gamma [Gammaproteobacteria bacterium]NIT63858.1 F0F1 ATP synthase subunit gamma [Gammaproteobacteria bacterium]NIV20862.1 F0F1 ATP synthase subunit gamma [Gammaproteobacteria bacterium]
METTEQLQRRIESFEELRSIVSTMKALSAVSIRQYEQAQRSLADYYRTVELGLHVVLRDVARAPSPRRRRQAGRSAAVVFGTDHGLCGRFNEDIAAHALERLQSVPAADESALMLAVGARAAGQLESAGHRVEEDLFVPGSAARITATVQQILLKIDEWRSETGVEYVHLFFNRATARSGYQPTGVQLLPVNLQRFHRLEERPWPSRRLPMYTMDRQQILARLLRQYFFVSLFRACAESQAAEHGSRLNAMQAAERNLDERLEEVTGEYRRVRQESITAELLDVVSGFEATAGGHE